MKRILVGIVLLAIAYFIFGFAAVKLKWLDDSMYYNLSAIIGGIASVSGLLAFASNKIEKKDIEAVGVEYFKKVVESAEELEVKELELANKDKQLSHKEKELKELEIKKHEMEFLVRKASMSLFLSDQFERTEDRISEIMDNNKELSRLITERQNLADKLKELQEEINKSEDVELLSSIITSSKNRHKHVRKRPSNFFEALWDVTETIAETFLRVK
jgi:predicted  nucleic acid-binding Zn-ribbon protein